MKSFLFSILITICSLTAYANNELSASDFQDTEYLKDSNVKETDLVFSDELLQEDVYKVTFEFETDNCALTGDVNVCELAMTCEYFKVDTYDNSIYPTEVKCTEDIEVVIGDVELNDEL